MRVAGLLLAAGAGRRFGGPKALVSHGGVLWVDRAAAVLRDAGCAPVVVVLGASAASVRARAALDGCVVVDNPDWATGMGSSLRAGLDALTGAGVGTEVDADAGRVDGPDVGVVGGAGVVAAGGVDVGAVVVLPVDTPGVTVAAVERLRALASPAALARASYDGAPGHPVLIGSEHWPGVAASAVGDAGARDYLRAHGALDVPCGDVADGDDVDHPRDLLR